MQLPLSSRVCARLPLSAGVQVDLVSLLDLQLLQGNDEDDEGLDLAAVPADHGVRPEVDGQEGEKSESELLAIPPSPFCQKCPNFCVVEKLLFVLGCKLSGYHES